MIIPELFLYFWQSYEFTIGLVYPRQAVYLFDILEGLRSIYIMDDFYIQVGSWMHHNLLIPLKYTSNVLYVSSSCLSIFEPVVPYDIAS